MPSHSTPSAVRRTLRRVILGAVTLAALLSSVTFAQPTRAVAAVGEDAVLNGSGTDLSAWRADSGAGVMRLSQLTTTGHPAGATSAVQVRRDDVAGDWAQVLSMLRSPAGWFQVGATYRMQAYVRDLDASNQPVGMLLANRSFAHRPTLAMEYARFADTSWHLLTRTFRCTAAAAPDTALYLDLPGSGRLRWQITGASVREVSVPGPATVSGPASRVLSFDGAAGTALDPTVWNHDTGTGWGPGQAQRYTTETANSSVDGSGHLVITARRDGASGSPSYTSARVSTAGKAAVPSGSYLESSIEAPVGAGLWPAFWLLGDAIADVGWPACGELDVLEVVGGAEPTVARSATHQAAQDDPAEDRPYGWDDRDGSVDLGVALDSAPHTYGVYFDAATVRFYVDRHEHLLVSADDAVASGRTWPFDRSFFIVLNIAIGGLEDPSTTSFPRTMTVGPISIWQGGTPF
jgi:hypothetical protein